MLIFVVGVEQVMPLEMGADVKVTVWSVAAVTEVVAVSSASKRVAVGLRPVGPVGPVGPVAPVGPVGPPDGPVGPMEPVAPVAPVGPPDGPVGPMEPVGPVGPAHESQPAST